MRWVTINNSSSRYTPVQLTSAECVRETAWVRWRRSQDEILCPRDRRFCLSFPLTSWHLWFPPQPFVGWSELWRLPSNCLPEQSSSSEEEQLQFNESVPPWGWVLRWCAMRRWRCAEDRDVKRFVSVLFATTTCSLDFDNGASSSICREIQCPVLFLFVFRNQLSKSCWLSKAIPTGKPNPPVTEDHYLAWDQISQFKGVWLSKGTVEQHVLACSLLWEGDLNEPWLHRTIELVLVHLGLSQTRADSWC